jgi:putative oxidoreductase
MQSEETEMAILDDLKPYAHWLLRAALASVFLFHGVGKLLGLTGFANMMGLPIWAAALVAFAETAAGAGIILGPIVGSALITRLAGVAIIPVMVGAITMVHWGRWSFTPSDTHPMGGMEFQVVLLLIGLYFLIVGNDDRAGI